MKQKQPIKQNPRPLPFSLFVPRSCLSFPTMALHQQPLHCNGCLLKASFLSTSHSSSSDRQSSKFPLRSDSIWPYLETKRMRVIKCHVFIFSWGPQQFTRVQGILMSEIISGTSFLLSNFAEEDYYWCTFVNTKELFSSITTGIAKDIIPVILHELCINLMSLYLISLEIYYAWLTPNSNQETETD